ncbi:kinase-like protein, partial [Dacryopinax primogenitus]
HIVREANVWYSLEHANLVSLYGVSLDTERERISLRSPWIPFGELGRYLKECESPDRLKLVQGIVRGTEYLHSKNLVHGDIRGRNVFVDSDGNAKLADFDISRLPGHLLETISSMGYHSQYRWMAPERIHPTLNGLTERTAYSRASDVYSVGMTILEIFTGRVPFQGSLDFVVLKGIINGLRPPNPGPAATEKGLSPELWKIMQACWDRDPAKRPNISVISQTIQSERRYSLHYTSTI